MEARDDLAAERQCAMRDTFYAAQFEFSEAMRALFTNAVPVLRLGQFAGWLAGRLSR